MPSCSSSSKLMVTSRALTSGLTSRHQSTHQDLVSVQCRSPESSHITEIPRRTSLALPSSIPTGALRAKWHSAAMNMHAAQVKQNTGTTAFSTAQVLRPWVPGLHTEDSPGDSWEPVDCMAPGGSRAPTHGLLWHPLLGGSASLCLIDDATGLPSRRSLCPSQNSCHAATRLGTSC